MIKRNIIDYLLLFVWIIIYVNINDNFSEASKGKIIAYGIMWCIVLLYVIIKVGKYLKK